MDNSEIALKLMPIIDISVDLIERVVRYWWKLQVIFLALL